MHTAGGMPAPTALISRLPALTPADQDTRAAVADAVTPGGVLEPPNAAPVVIEDDAFIGSRSMVVESARIRRGAKLGADVIVTKSTREFGMPCRGEAWEDNPEGRPVIGDVREGSPSERRRACWYWRTDADGNATWGRPAAPCPSGPAPACPRGPSADTATTTDARSPTGP